MESTPNVWQKYWAILSSPRFHQAVAAFALLTLSHYGYIDMWLSESIATLLGISITIGTVDRLAKPVS